MSVWSRVRATLRSYEFRAGFRLGWILGATFMALGFLVAYALHAAGVIP